MMQAESWPALAILLLFDFSFQFSFMLVPIHVKFCQKIGGSLCSYFIYLSFMPETQFVNTILPHQNKEINFIVYDTILFNFMIFLRIFAIKLYYNETNY
jgi:hypothetical protein